MQAYLTGSLELERAGIQQLHLITLKVFSSHSDSVIHGFTETTWVTGTETGTTFKAAF